MIDVRVAVDRELAKVRRGDRLEQFPRIIRGLSSASPEVEPCRDEETAILEWSHVHRWEKAAGVGLAGCAVTVEAPVVAEKGGHAVWFSSVVGQVLGAR